jgi:hypothetical protein
VTASCGRRVTAIRQDARKIRRQIPAATGSYRGEAVRRQPRPRVDRPIPELGLVAKPSPKFKGTGHWTSTSWCVPNAPMASAVSDVARSADRDARETRRVPPGFRLAPERRCGMKNAELPFVGRRWTTAGTESGTVPLGPGDPRRTRPTAVPGVAETCRSRPGKRTARWSLTAEPPDGEILGSPHDSDARLARDASALIMWASRYRAQSRLGRGKVWTSSTFPLTPFQPAFGHARFPAGR